MTQHNESARTSASSAASTPAWESRTETQITLRSPAELADALPYLMGFHPTDSVVMLALHGERGRFGGRLRLGIPDNEEEWSDVSDQLAETLVAGCGKRGSRPDGIVLFLCQDPAKEEESARQVMERLRPLAQSLRLACGGLDVPVYEALCISGGRFWSYCCPDERCCPPEGTPLAVPGTSVMAAAAAYAGIQVRGTLREMESRYAPLAGRRAEEQESALDAAAADLIPRILRGTDCETVRHETLDLARLVMERFHDAPPAASRPEADARDDDLLASDEAAAIVLGLQDRTTRDRAAEWMEGPKAPAALRVWRALARRCVGPYVEHAAAPLTLAGWVAWSTGDHPEARVALSRALSADPEYLFAQLLHRACNDGMDPELLRRCLRRERADRVVNHRAVGAGADRPGASVPTASVDAPENDVLEVAAEAEAPGDTQATDNVATGQATARATAQAATPAGGSRRRGTSPVGPGGANGKSRPDGAASANGPAGKARTRRRAGQRGVRGRQ
ncbi:DUF4192 domain-containing protein [Streptomyces sp. NPDC053079]|uniref:DUF4192 domain-containing protein n=1 Tax=Streptomyces sp. NPDC053079 TaxID=3365697 RepID=UPI0037D5B1A2